MHSAVQLHKCTTLVGDPGPQQEARLRWMSSKDCWPKGVSANLVSMRTLQADSAIAHIVVVCLPLVHQNKYWGVRGVYQAHIEMWMQHIPRRNLLLLSHDELQFSPSVTTRRCVAQLYAV